MKIEASSEKYDVVSKFRQLAVQQCLESTLDPSFQSIFVYMYLDNFRVSVSDCCLSFLLTIPYNTAMRMVLGTTLQCLFQNFAQEEANT